MGQGKIYLWFLLVFLVCETSELGKYGRYLDAGKDKVKGPGAENPENKNRFLERHFLKITC